jgi:hypothetical protein
MLEWAAFFLGAYADPATRFQTILAACRSCDRLGFRLHASGLQSPIQVRLFLALDDGRCPLQHSQCRTTALSLVQSRCAGLLPALCRLHCRPIPGGSIDTKGDWSSSFGSSDNRCFDLPGWISHGTCHSSPCPLSTLDFFLDAPE